MTTLSYLPDLITLVRVSSLHWLPRYCSSVRPDRVYSLRGFEAFVPFALPHTIEVSVQVSHPQKASIGIIFPYYSLFFFTASVTDILLRMDSFTYIISLPHSNIPRSGDFIYCGMLYAYNRV